LAEDLKVYIHQINFCQLTIELKANKARQKVIEEIRDYYKIQSFFGYHVKNHFYPCFILRWNHNEYICRSKIIELPPLNKLWIWHARYFIFEHGQRLYLNKNMNEILRFEHKLLNNSNLLHKLKINFFFVVAVGYVTS